MIPDEPVRGQLPAPWVRSLSGLEIAELYARRQLPPVPVSRLLGTRIGNVVPGGVTMTQPAAQALIATTGQLSFAGLATQAAYFGSASAVGPNTVLRPLSLRLTAFRPLRPQPGNLIARARIVHKSRIAVFTEAHAEDPEGRSIGHVTLTSVIKKLDKPAPPPPATIPRVEEPVYETPDPYLRNIPMELNPLGHTRPAYEVMKELQAEGKLSNPVLRLLGLEITKLEPGMLESTIPASEWFAIDQPNVSEVILAMFTELSQLTLAISLIEGEERVIAVDESIRFVREVPLDGRPLRCRAHGERLVNNLILLRTEVTDADGNFISDGTGTCRVLSPEEAGVIRKKTERVLATLAFVDIVGSTDHLARMGDAEWNAALERYNLSVRREISRFNGVEVATAGDGFFLRFESPLRAIEAARAIREAAKRENLQVRTGIHTGECEIQGNTLAGIAVHLASRIEDAAGAGEIFVSSTVRDLVSGAGIEFEDRGEHELKGIPDARRLFAVAGA